VTLPSGETMLKFSANLSMLFTELPFLDRFAAAAKAGFTGVEYVAPYAYPPAEIVSRLSKHQLTQALFNMPAGNWENGDRGLACDPARKSEFVESIATTIDWAKTLNCKTINCLAGIAPPNVAEDMLWKTYVQNIALAGRALHAEGIQLVVEAINTYDMPGYFLNRSFQAIRAISDSGQPTIKFQYDVYHMQRMEGELTNTLTALMPMIGHIQIAGAPHRHEPNECEINYPHILKHIEDLGYAGWVGCEYKPRGKTSDGLGWLNDYRARS
jgi:hydroxypyruvate isomerase